MCGFLKFSHYFNSIRGFLIPDNVRFFPNMTLWGIRWNTVGVIGRSLGTKLDGVPLPGETCSPTRVNESVVSTTGEVRSVGVSRPDGSW